MRPSAKLSASFPRESGQQPYFYNHKNTGRPAPDTRKAPFYPANHHPTKNPAEAGFFA